MGTYTVWFQSPKGGDWALLWTINSRSSETPELCFPLALQQMQSAKWAAIKCQDQNQRLMWSVTA